MWGSRNLTAADEELEATGRRRKLLATLRAGFPDDDEDNEEVLRVP
jgi:hypothetical protein